MRHRKPITLGLIAGVSFLAIWLYNREHPDLAQLRSFLQEAKANPGEASVETKAPESSDKQIRFDITFLSVYHRPTEFTGPFAGLVDNPQGLEQCLRRLGEAGLTNLHSKPSTVQSPGQVAIINCSREGTWLDAYPDAPPELKARQCGFMLELRPLML